MARKYVTAYCGEGRGKTSAALGQAVLEAGRGKNVIVIQFMKGNRSEALDMMGRLEPEIKVFDFEKHRRRFNELSPEEQKEEMANIRNAFAFARKVLSTGGCDTLILDEVLGVIDCGLISVEEMMSLLAAKHEETKLIITGINISEALMPYIDRIYEIRPIKTEEEPAYDGIPVNDSEQFVQSDEEIEKNLKKRLEKEL